MLKSFCSAPFVLWLSVSDIRARNDGDISLPVKDPVARVVPGVGITGSVRALVADAPRSLPLDYIMTLQQGACTFPTRMQQVPPGFYNCYDAVVSVKRPEIT